MAARWRRECDSCTPDFHLSTLLPVARVAVGWHSASNVDAAVPIRFRSFIHPSYPPLNADNHPRTHQSRMHEGPLVAVRAGPAHSCCSDKEEKFRFGAGCAFSCVALVASVGLQRLNVAPGKTCFEVIQLPPPADMPAFFHTFPFLFPPSLVLAWRPCKLGSSGRNLTGCLARRTARFGFGLQALRCKVICSVGYIYDSFSWPSPRGEGGP